MTIRQGDIFWADLGAPRGSEPAYRHPYIVIQNHVFNQSKINTTVVCALTSNLKRARAPGNVFLQRGEGNIKKDSVVNISQIITVDKSDLVEKIGSISPSRITEIIEGVRLLIGPREI
jgi:mRNA interferase MazF